MAVQDRIQELLGAHDVVLFMKGSRAAPQCGFSATLVNILDEYLPDYATVNVLEDPEIRQGIKEFANWPTIPQLYVKGDFVGGCDIVREMRESGELDSVLGRAPGEVPEPVLSLTAAARKAFVDFMEGQGTPTVRLQITGSFDYGMELDDRRAADIAVDAGGVFFVMDRATAGRADGLAIDYVEGALGAGFKMDNPNEPPRVQNLEPTTLKEWMDEGAPVHIFDVRTPEEFTTAHIDGTRLLDEEGKELLERLDKDVRLVFVCHTGRRSAMAAQHYLRAGFRDVWNLRGGVDAWSHEVDPTVPRY